MNNKKSLIIMILSMLTAIVLTIGIIIFSVNKKEQTLIDNINIIKRNYANLSFNVSDNAKMKTELLVKIDEFNNEISQEEYGNIKETLQKYDRSVKYVENIIEDMKTRCSYNYDDLTANILCMGYETLYEETVNTYVKVVTSYNDKLKKYNETAEIPYELHESLYNEYVDYDKDGKYAEK